MSDKKYKLYKNGLSKKIISLVAGATMFFEVMGGNVANIVKSPIIGTMETLAADHIGDIDDDILVTIPDGAEWNVKRAIEEALDDYNYFTEDNKDIKLSDFKKIKSLSLHASDLEDATWLTHCENLEEVEIYINETSVDKLRNMDFSHIKKLKLSQQISTDVLSLKEEDFNFLEKYYFDELYLSFIIADMGNSKILSKINADTLYIDFMSYETKINYDLLANINNLIISISNPYDIPINLCDSKIKKLEARGINVRFDLEPEEYNKYVACSEKLDKVYKSLKISDNDSDIEKINKILIYVLDNFEYDPVIADKIANEEEHSELTQKMYEEGGLTPFMNDSKYFICGNYSALFSALLTRANVDAYIIFSGTHAWNLVEVDDEYYYFDATWLDGTEISRKEYKYDDEGNIISQNAYSIPVLELIKNNEPIPEDVWYKVLVSNYKELDSSESHDTSYIPNYVDLATELEKEEITGVKDFSNKKFKIKVGAKEYIIAGSTLIAIMAACGAAIAVGKKKKKNKAKRNVINYNNPYEPYNPYSPYDYMNYNQDSGNYNNFKF